MSDERTRPAGSSESNLRDERSDAPVARAQPRPREPGQRGEPTYSEKQVAQILQRAASLERGRAQPKPALSLAEVEEIAREAGLDPSLVRLAAQSLEVAERERSWGARLAGAPLRRVFERVVDGELTQALHERLSSDLRAAMRAENPQRPPQISSVGRTLTMSARTAAGAIEVELTPRGNQTLLRIDVSCGQLAGGLFGGMGGGLGGGMTPAIIGLSASAHWAAPAIALAGAGFLGGVFLVTRTLYSFAANRLYRRMDKLADQLAGQLRDELSQTP